MSSFRTCGYVFAIFGTVGECRWGFPFLINVGDLFIFDMGNPFVIHMGDLFIFDLGNHKGCPYVGFVDVFNSGLNLSSFHFAGFLII
jgi:hypothetical protein